MVRKNQAEGQCFMFDPNGEPTFNNGQDIEEIDLYLTSQRINRKKPKNNIAMTVVEPAKSKLVESFVDLDGDNEEGIKVFVPFDFYDTGLVDAIETREKFETKSCIEFYFHVLDGDYGYVKFRKQLENIEKYFSRFFGYDSVKDKEYLRKNMGFKKNRTNQNTIEGRAKQDRTNQFIKAAAKIKGVKYDRGWVHIDNSLGKNGGLRENKEKFINYPHEEWETRLVKWMNDEEYDYPSTQTDAIEGVGKIATGKIITEIGISRNASFDKEKGLHGKVPFYFFNTGVVDHINTMGKYTLKECVVFYLKVINKESHYGERFSDLLPNIEKYFMDFCRWDGRESLQEYLDLNESISKGCKDEIILSLSGGLYVERMYRKFGDKKSIDIIDKILKSKSPFDDLLLWTLLNKFFKDIGVTDEIQSIEEQKENLILFFGKILDALKNNGIGDKIHEFGENRWKSYEKIFDIIFKSFGKVRQYEDKWKLTEEDKRELTKEDKREFEDWFDNRYPHYEVSVRDSIWQLLNSFEHMLVKDISKYNFLVAMFASYMRKGVNAEIVDVYKRNLIRIYLEGLGKETSNREENPYTRKKNGGDRYPNLNPFDGDNFAFDESGNRIWEEKDIFPGVVSEIGMSDNISGYHNDDHSIEEGIPSGDFDKFDNKILKPEYIDGEIGNEENSKELNTVDKLIKMMKEERGLEKFTINTDHEYIVDKTTDLILDFAYIFEEEEDRWKIRILERAEQDKGKDGMKSIEVNDYRQGIGFEDIDGKLEKEPEDDDLPF